MTIPVAIVGAGLAGLYAGYLLKARGIDFRILEATDRPGGRVLGKAWSNDADNGLNLDLGPTWLWSHQTELLALLERLEIEIFEQYHQGDALFEADAQSAVERFVPSFMKSLRVRGGMNRLTDRLADEVAESIILNCAVTNIRSTSAKSDISCDHRQTGRLSADTVIVAAPPRVIADKLEATDDRLRSVKTALARVPTWMAAQAKFVVGYSTPFWRDKGLSGHAFSRCGPMTEIHDASSSNDEGFALFGFIGVPARDRINVRQEDLKRACLSQMAKIFGDQAGDFESCYLVDWAQNKFTAAKEDIHGKPEHPLVDLTPYRQCLQDNRLIFAGSEFAKRDPGYLLGAIVAADNAVQELGSR